jgi:hypothetical protein
MKTGQITDAFDSSGRCGDKERVELNCLRPADNCKPVHGSCNAQETPRFCVIDAKETPNYGTGLRVRAMYGNR